MDELIKMRNTFASIVEIIDELVLLNEREKLGEDIVKESESLTGRLMFKLIELDGFKNN